MPKHVNSFTILDVSMSSGLYTFVSIWEKGLLHRQNCRIHPTVGYLHELSPAQLFRLIRSFALYRKVTLSLKSADILTAFLWLKSKLIIVSKYSYGHMLKPVYSIATIDVNECLATPCDANAVCTNTPGSFTCACNPGYSGDGLTCSGT